MPWKETSMVEERLRFVARLLEGEGMSDLCREFGISRRTGYKIFNRYKEDGLEALTDRSRRPVRYANQLPEPVEAMIVRLKKEKPHWGARKIRELLVKRLAGDVRVPAKSTVHAVLDRHGLVAHARKRQRCRAGGTALSQALLPNDLWCADFKGEFKLGNGQYCYPLTVTDQASRYLLPAKPLNRRANQRSSMPSAGCLSNTVCRERSGATMVCLSPVPMGSTISRSCRSGGCGSASRSSASGRAVPNRTVGMSACT